MGIRLAIFAVLTLAVLVFLVLTRSFRPGDLSRNPRNVQAYPAVTWFLAAVAVYIALIFGVSAAHMILGVPTDATQLESAGPSVIGYVLALIVAGFLWHILARGASSSGLHPRPFDVPIGLVCFALAAAPILLTSDASTLIYEAITDEAPEPIAHDTLRELTQRPITAKAQLLMASAVIGAPIIEEIVYRLFLQTSLLRLTRSPWAAILITSVLFTIMHLGPVPVYGLPTLLVLSIAMGLAYERTKRPGVPIMMHMLFNAANVAMVAFDPVS